MSTTLALVDQLAWLRLLPGCSQNTTTAAEERRKGKCRGGANLSNNGYGVVMMMDGDDDNDGDGDNDGDNAQRNAQRIRRLMLSGLAAQCSAECSAD